MSADLHGWWLATELTDPEVTHVVTFRPVVRVALALAPGAEASEVIAAATAAWRAALASAEGGPVAWSEQLWQRPLGDHGLVVRVEIPDAEVHVEDGGGQAVSAARERGSGGSPPHDSSRAGPAGGEG